MKNCLKNPDTVSSLPQKTNFTSEIHRTIATFITRITQWSQQLIIDEHHINILHHIINTPKNPPAHPKKHPFTPLFHPETGLHVNREVDFDVTSLHADFMEVSNLVLEASWGLMGVQRVTAYELPQESPNVPGLPSI